MAPMAMTMNKMCYSPVVEHLPTICEVLGSIPAKQREKKEKKKKDRGGKKSEEKRGGGKAEEGEEKRINNRKKIKRDADRLLCLSMQIQLSEVREKVVINDPDSIIKVHMFYEENIRNDKEAILPNSK